MKKYGLTGIFLAAVLLLSACGASGGTTASSGVAGSDDQPKTVNSSEGETQSSDYADEVDFDMKEESVETETANPSAGTAEDMEKKTSMTMTIGDTPVQVKWENNDSVDALKEMVKDQPLTIQMSMYGGFEQVGSIGKPLPREDAQTTTSAGDIVLYSGDQIVVFYGVNSWAYTRLGRVTDKTDAEMADLLSNGDATITIAAE